MGLLQKTISISNNNNLFFSHFLTKYNLNMCALLEKVNLSFLIRQSIGFDCISIISSISSCDFWNGTLREKNKWYSFINNSEMLPFFQLFSFSQKEKIKNIHICYINENQILMICNLQDTKLFLDKNFTNDVLNIQKDIPTITNQIQLQNISDFNFLNITIDFTEIINKMIKQYLRNNEFEQEIKKWIYFNIEQNLSCYFSTPHYIAKTNDVSYKVLFNNFSNSASYNLINSHIKYLFTSFFNDVELINIQNNGISTLESQVQNFIKG